MSIEYALGYERGWMFAEYLLAKKAEFIGDKWEYPDGYNPFADGWRNGFIDSYERTRPLSAKLYKRIGLEPPVKKRKGKACV